MILRGLNTKCVARYPNNNKNNNFFKVDLLILFYYVILSVCLYPFKNVYSFCLLMTYIFVTSFSKPKLELPEFYVLTCMIYSFLLFIYVNFFIIYFNNYFLRFHHVFLPHCTVDLMALML